MQIFLEIMPVQSPEYTVFLQEEQLIKKRTFYEKLCGISGKVLPLSPWSALTIDYNRAIDFSHLKITPRGAFSLTILSALLILLLPVGISLVGGFFSSTVLILAIIFSFLAFFYFYTYPTRYATTFRIKSTAEMMLAIIYMTISMRISPNIESAVRFAATNLSGPLAYDLRKVIWDVYTRKYGSMSDALDAFTAKWRTENEEFTQALSLIKSTVYESRIKLEETLDEAVKILLDGTKERMKHYAQDMRTPVAILNAMGILLPIIGLVFFPILSLFLQVIDPSLLVIGYNILLPLGVYWLLEIYLERRPYTFHQPDLSKHPKFIRHQRISRAFVFSFVVASALIALGSSQLIPSTARFDPTLLLYSVVITWGIAAGIILYAILSVFQKMKLRDEIAAMENEFAEAIFQLGNQLSRGIPIEKAIKNAVPKIRDLKICQFWEVVLYNIETLGQTFEQAIFDERTGAIKMYPSKMIEAVMKATVEISRRGMEYVAKSLLSVSAYLKNLHVVEEDLKEILSETTSTMALQALLLAPLTAGIVVGLTAMITQILISLKGAVEKIFGTLGAYGPLGSAGSVLVRSIVDIEKLIPVHYFQIIVGVYMLEVVGIIAIAMSVIDNGDENLKKRYSLGKLLLASTVIYTVVLLAVYGMFTAIIPITELLQ